MLSIILPVKNESDIIEQSITSFHKEIKEKLNSTEFEFVIVLNGCTDNSEIKINNLKEQFNINVVKLRKSNYGLALKTGILNSSST